MHAEDEGHPVTGGKEHQEEVRETGHEVRTLLCREFTSLTQDDLLPDLEILELPGADSVRLMRVMSAIEDRFGILLDDDVVFGVRTVGEIIEAVEELR